MTTAAQKAGYEKTRQAAIAKQAARRAAANVAIKSKYPQAHRGDLGLTVSEDGRPLIARDGRGGVPPSVWETMLLEKFAQICRLLDGLDPDSLISCQVTLKRIEEIMN